MKLRNVDLSIENIARDSENGALNAIEASALYDYADGKRIVGYAINCEANHRDTIKVKLPCNELISDKISDLKIRLEKADYVRVAFTNILFKAYAMKNEVGNVISGVSASADDFSIDDEVII